MRKKQASNSLFSVNVELMLGLYWAYLGFVGSVLGNLEAMSGKSWAKAFALRTTYFLAPKRKPSNSSYWVHVGLMLGLYWAMFGRCLPLDLSLLMRSGPWIL